MNRVLVSLLALLFFLPYGYAQQKAKTIEQRLSRLSSYEERFEALRAIPVDSLRNYVPSIADTILKIDVLHAYIDRLHSQIDASLGEDALNVSYQLSRKVSYQKGIAKALKSYGDIHTARGDFAKATAYFNQSMQVAQKIPYYEVLSANMVAFAGIYKKQADYGKALRYYLQALEMSEKTGSAPLIARRLYNLATFYKNAGNLDESSKYARQSLQKSQDTTLQTLNYHLISEVLNEQKQYDRALAYLYKSLAILPHNAGVLYHIGLTFKHQQQNDSARYYLEKSLQAIPEGASYKNLRLDAMADLYEQEGKFDQALEYRLSSLQEVLKLNERHTEAGCYNKLAHYYHLRNNPMQTIRYAKQALTIAQELKALPEVKDALYYLGGAHAAIEQYKLAYEYTALFHQIRDSISDANTTRKIVQMEMQHAFDKKQAAQQLALGKQSQQAQIRHQQQQNFIYFLMLCSFLCALVAFVFYRYYCLKRKDNHLLQQFNREVNEQKEEISAQAEELKEINEEIQKINESLETTVLQRTCQLEKQNQQLINYAFFNAHKLRGPLARIMGLVNLLKIDAGISSQETKLIISKLEKSSEELDNVVKEINTVLHPEHAVNNPVKD